MNINGSKNLATVYNELMHARPDPFSLSEGAGLQTMTATSIIFSYFLFFVASDVSVSSLHHNTFFKKFFV